MKETFYFSHDYNARNDEKILKLIKNEGWEGYGIFWAIVEKLYEADGFLEEDYECIAFDLRMECERIERVIKHYNLFVVESKKIYSNSILARLRKRKGRSEQARQSANIRWNKQNNDDANALPTQSECNAIKESKVKESKIKESRDESRFAPPSLNEIQTYCLERNNGINAEQFHDFYSSKGWMVGKNKMKDWRAAVRTWEKRDTGQKQNENLDLNSQIRKKYGLEN